MKFYYINSIPLSRRRMFKKLLLLVVLLLSGCSVTPLYDSGNDGTIQVDVIANREGQQLRRYLKNRLHNISSQNYTLTVTLKVQEKPFAEMTDDNAQRMEVRYYAHVILRDTNRITVFEDDFFAATSNNISSGHGDVIFSLYGRNNINLLTELGSRIVESIRIFVRNEE